MEEWDWILQINLYGVIRGARAFIPHMLERGSGYLVNTASVAGLYAYAWDHPTYITAKFGVAAGALWIGRRDLWLKIALLIAGGVTIVIAMVHMVDAGSKARDIEVQFGIPAGDVSAQVGVGLYLVVVGGLGLLAAGLRARTDS